MRRFWPRTPNVYSTHLTMRQSHTEPRGPSAIPFQPKFSKGHYGRDSRITYIAVQLHRLIHVNLTLCIRDIYATS